MTGTYLFDRNRCKSNTKGCNLKVLKGHVILENIIPFWDLAITVIYFVQVVIMLLTAKDRKLKWVRFLAVTMFFLHWLIQVTLSKPLINKATVTLLLVIILFIFIRVKVDSNKNS